MPVKITALLCIILIISPGAARAFEAPANKGSLVIAGGNVDPGNRSLYERFIECAERFRGRKKGDVKIGIIPAGSFYPQQSADAFRKTIVSFGVPESNVEIIPIAIEDDSETKEIDESKWKQNALDPDWAGRIEACDGIWFVGGDQKRYIEALAPGRSTPALDAIRKIYGEGAVLGGTSAGAAIMSDPMIGGGESLSALNYGSVTDEEKFHNRGVLLRKGLGFFTPGMVDQHFNQRGRFGRLLVAAIDTGARLAFGVDEDTAMIVDNEKKTIEAAGTNGVTIIDLTQAFRKADPGKCAINNIKVSYIEQGDVFHVETRTFDLPSRSEITEIDPDDSPIVEGSVFFSLRNLLTFSLFPADRSESKGLALQLKSDDMAESYLVKMRKERDTRIAVGTIDGRESCAAVNVHMDIIPVTLKIEKDL